MYDRAIPLVECQDVLDVSWRQDRTKQYCPNYGDEAFIYGTFYTKRFSRLRLALHLCEDTPEAEEERRQAGKKHVKCVSRDESFDYFAQNIIGLDIFTQSPTLGHEGGEALAKETTSLHFSIRAVRDFTTYRDIGLVLSRIELEDHWLVNFFPSMTVEEKFIKFKNILGDFYKVVGSDGTNKNAKNQ